MQGSELVDQVAVELLPAEHGDCILVRAALTQRGAFTDANPAGRGEFRILIDTGPGQASLEVLRHRLAAIDPGIDGNRWIDLAVFTHLDADHIGNATALLTDSDLRLRFGDIWFNGHTEVARAARRDPHLADLLIKSYPQADSLSETITSGGFPHNRAFGGGPVVVPPDRDWFTVRFEEPPSDPDDALPVLTLLTPTQQGLARLLSDWDRYRAQFERGESEPGNEPRMIHDGILTKSASEPDLVDSIEAWAQEPFLADRSVPNGSSIAFVVEHRGRQLLFLGDAHAADYEHAYATWRGQHPGGGLDVVKLSHHGSRRNTTVEFAGLGARNYLVSSNGERFGHPDDVTLARLVVAAPPAVRPKLWFNYATPAALRWQALAATDGRFDIELPPEDASTMPGVVLMARLPR